MTSAIESVVEAPSSNVEAADVVAVDWNDEAEAAIEEFEQPYISCIVGWQFGDIDWSMA